MKIDKAFDKESELFDLFHFAYIIFIIFQTYYSKIMKKKEEEERGYKTYVLGELH